MKKDFLNTLEEKFIFKISRYFWHIIIAIGSLGLLTAILFLLWGIFPSIKNSVDKENYPPVAQVTLDEITASLEKSTQSKKEIEADNKPTQEVATSIDYINYQKAIDSLKTFLPEDKVEWKSKGYWEYPYGKSYYDYYKQEYYRNWKISYYGITEILDADFNDSKAESYTEKRELILSTITILKAFQLDDRRDILIYTIVNSSSFNHKINFLSALSKTISFTTDKSLFLNLSSFLRRGNNINSADFVNLVNQTFPSFDKDSYNDALTALINNYNKYFSNNFSEQADYTKSYLTLLPQIQKENKIKYLDSFYKLAIEKNSDRKYKISEIENEFSRKNQEAELDYQTSQVAKAEYRLKGIYGIAGGILIISFFALLLVLFSMNRYLKKLNEKLTVSEAKQ